MASEKALPIKKMNIGVINLAIWRNDVRFGREGDSRVMYSVTMERRYKDQNGAWQSSGSFRMNDIPKLKLLLEKAYEYLTMDMPEGADGTDRGGSGDDE